mmetsp:Transcript_125220/g.243679  ORF Transcript_125220/g.243679 Transcript_125220/m.243679 type:complete len:273 (-) Transcript_125220:7-825(-)
MAVRNSDQDPKWDKVRNGVRAMYGKDAVWRFRQDHFFLSNMYMAPGFSVEFNSLRFLSTEHAFVAAKSLSREEQETIRDTPDPKDAKRFGRQLQLRDDWDDIKFDVMLDLLRRKFEHNLLAEHLISTGTRCLVEGNLWHDTIWGMAMVDGHLQGDNMLGKLLMQVRSELVSGGIKELKKQQRNFEAGVTNKGELQTPPDKPHQAFFFWLQGALTEEMSVNDAESILVAVEVILQDADGDCEAVHAAAIVVRDSGAPDCADALPEQWLLHVSG